MKSDGLLFVFAVLMIAGFAKLLWNYINLIYEVQDLRKKLGKGNPI